MGAVVDVGDRLAPGPIGLSLGPEAATRRLAALAGGGIRGQLDAVPPPRSLGRHVPVYRSVHSRPLAPVLRWNVAQSGECARLLRPPSSPHRSSCGWSSADPSLEGAHGYRVGERFPAGVLDLVHGPSVVRALQRVARFATEGAVGVGDVSAQSVLLDGEGNLFPPVVVAAVGRRGAEGGGEVFGPVVAVPGDAA